MRPAVFFFIDPEIMDDPQLKNVRSVTLCYTCFFFRLIGMIMRRRGTMRKRRLLTISNILFSDFLDRYVSGGFGGYYDALKHVTMVKRAIVMICKK